MAEPGWPKLLAEPLGADSSEMVKLGQTWERPEMIHDFMMNLMYKYFMLYNII